MCLGKMVVRYLSKQGSDQMPSFIAGTYDQGLLVISVKSQVGKLLGAFSVRQVILNDQVLAREKSRRCQARTALPLGASGSWIPSSVLSHSALLPSDLGVS